MTRWELQRGCGAEAGLGVAQVKMTVAAQGDTSFIAAKGAAKGAALP